MGKIKRTYQQNEMMKKIIVMIIAGLVTAVGLNMFLIPASVFSVGVNGISQLISITLYSSTGIHIDTGILIFVLNIPIAVLGWLKLGKEATIYSLMTVALVSITTIIIPVHAITDNILMNAIAGGVLIGLAGGLTMKFGFSGGGMDIVSLILAKTTGKTVGSLTFWLNLVIIFFAGLLVDWESALFTIISMFCLSQVTDAIHTNHQKVTVFIMTSRPEVVVQSIQNELIRGMTMLPAKGVYSQKDVSVIMIVVTRYELYALEQAVATVDQDAFMNIIPTQTVLGNFWDEDQQKIIRSAK
ncbi:YitT family protein [Vagococcus acidifermentans]|uniref:DUF2179 domain-containing protein n=1 Tax=Vagococcus acidifermentans TaxID=564710 RepID=A0A430AXW9_9ENTE|nr:YitT family protein [Vagococcus acidifermentans]RSU12903.1 hypothetical protein CBF27_05015 [Vagococcus acidifermentans]